MTDILEPRYTPKEVAAALGVKVQQVLLFISSGELQAINVAKPGAQRPSWKIRKSDWELFEESRKNRRLDQPRRSTRKPRKKAKARFSGIKQRW